jgi:hypothetical protein
MLLVGAVLALLGASAMAAAAPVSVMPFGVEAILSGGPIPDKLPARKPAPVSFLLAERVQTSDGSHPPALQELEVELDRHFAVAVDGLPSCRPGLQYQGMAITEQCGRARVGGGRIDIEVAFPEQPLKQVEGRLQVFNGGTARGRTTFWLYVSFPAPINGSMFIPLNFRNHPNGRYELQGTLEMPKIANGAASLTYFGARFRKGIFSAACPGGKLQEHATNRFADGSVRNAALVRVCRAASSSG